MRHGAIILLTVATALVHFSFFIRDPRGGLIYLLNGLGYLCLLGLMYSRVELLRPYYRFVPAVFIGYTILTILLYVIVAVQIRDWTLPLGPLDKAAELMLLTLLWTEARHGERILRE